MMTSIDENSIMGGGYNWVGTKSMQVILQGHQESDTVNEAGKKHLTRRDEIWNV